MAQGLQMLIVKFKWDNVPTYSSMDNFINYDGEMYSLSLEKKNDLYGSIPDIFKNEKEKISRFIVTRRLDDSNSYEYSLEVKRKIFNYRTREYVEETRDISNVYTDHQYGILKDYFYSKFTEYYLNDFGDITDKLYNNVDKNINISSNIIKYRNELLLKTDKYMISDYPISEEEREEWKVYRQKLRDLTEQENWPGNVINITFPTPPNVSNAPTEIKTFLSTSTKVKQLMEQQLNFGTELETQVEYVCEKLVEMTVKLDILEQFSRIRVPGFDFKDGYFSVFNQLQANQDPIFIDSSNDPYDTWTTAIDQIESKLSEIDTVLESANYTWRVSDVLNRVIQAADDKEGPDGQEATEIIQGL